MREKFSEIGEVFRKSRESHPMHWLLIVLSIGIVSGIGGGAIAVFVLRTTPLPYNDKYDIFVALFLIFLTLLGILGYGMYIWIRGKLESWLNKRLQNEEQQIKNRQNLHIARVYRGMGYTFWQLFLVWENVKLTRRTPDSLRIKEISDVLIGLARDRAERSLNFAKKLPKHEYKEDINQCKANKVYFLAEAARIESTEEAVQQSKIGRKRRGNRALNLKRSKNFSTKINCGTASEVTKLDKEQALKVVNEILTEVSKQDYREDYYQYWESCAWALQHLSETGDKISKQKAGDIIRELIADTCIPFSWREEQKEKWAHFLKKERDLSTSIKNT